MSSVWESAYDEAQRRDGPLDLSRTHVEDALRAHLTRRLAPLELAPLESTLEDLLARSAGADLVLAVAVESGVPGAAARLRGRVTDELEAVGKKRGIVAARARRQAEAVVAEALGPALLPPARTRLAAYDGSCALVTWLALALEGRVVAEAREPAPGESAPPPEPPSPESQHPSPNLLGGLVEGRLLVAEAQAVVQHVGRCTRCSALLRGLGLAGRRAEQPTPSLDSAGLGARAPGRRWMAAPPAGPRRTRATLLAGALVVGVIALAASGGAGSLLPWSVAREQDTEAEVHEAAIRLASQEQGLFADFQPYGREELERAPTLAPGAVAAQVELAGPRPLHPKERVLSTTPTFLWEPVLGAARYALTLRDEDGQVVWTGQATGRELAWPAGLAPLERGMPMTWEIAAEGSTTSSTRLRFSAAPERDAIHWQRRVERLPEVLRDERVRTVLQAQLALRRGHVWEAYAGMRGHVERYPHDRYGAAFAGFLRRHHDLP